MFFCKLYEVNYLAHAYLSFGDPEVTTGNLISDFVKGKKKYDYPPRILGGINLHRAIDEFTDVNSINKEIAKIFKPSYGLYSSALLDVVYDHFLALEIAGKGDDVFERFTLNIYKDVEQFRNILPSTFNNIFPYMKQHNWLYGYQFAEGIEKSLAGLVHRAAYLSDSKTAFHLFKNNYEDFRLAFAAFFPLVKEFSLKKFADIH